MDQAAIKQVKIQTGVVKRLMKEHASYMKEAEKEMQRIENMRAEAQNDDDEYKITKAEQVLQETRQMVVEVARRCVKATAELRRLIDDCKSEEECQELTEAKLQIEAASTISSD